MIIVGSVQEGTKHPARRIMCIRQSQRSAPESTEPAGAEGGN